MSRSASPPNLSWVRGGTLKRLVSARPYHGPRDNRTARRLRPLPRIGPRRLDPGCWRETSGSRSGKPAGWSRCARRLAALERFNPFHWPRDPMARSASGDTTRLRRSNRKHARGSSAVPRHALGTHRSYRRPSLCSCFRGFSCFDRAGAVPKTDCDGSISCVDNSSGSLVEASG